MPAPNRNVPEHPGLRRLAPMLVVAVLVMAAPGCRDGTTGPSPFAPGVVPLALGDRWVYHRTVAARAVEDTVGYDEYVEERDAEYQIVGQETIGGRAYAVQEHRPLPPGSGVTQWFRYRQDDSGLYSADVAGNTPPAGAPSPPEAAASLARPALPTGPHADAWREAWRELERKRAALRDLPGDLAPARSTAGEGEITSLAYPLEAGAEWVIRSVPFRVAATVEGWDRLVTPTGLLSGWRIRILNSQLGPEDDALAWWGPQGQLGHWYRLRAEATDTQGILLGVIELTEAEQLVEFTRGFGR